MKNWIIQNIINFPTVKTEIERRYIKRTFPIQYNEDGIITKHIPGFLEDEKFLNAYEKGKDTGAWINFPIRWRAYVCCWAAQRAMKLEGDFVECGIDKGGLSRTIAEYIGLEKSHKQMFLIDSFDGIPLQHVHEKEFEINDPHRWNKKYGDTEQLVKENFRKYPNVSIIKGIIPDILEEITVSKICYLSIDLNNFQPEIAAIRYFWDKIVTNGVVILDDYAYDEKFIMQRNAWDDFSYSKGVEIFNLPTGQGLLIKD